MDPNLSKWFPVATSSDVPMRHVFQAQLLGREFAVWRADDGNVNVWENRCLHRGVRLSIGINEGSELKCQYHGWRYANRTAGCTYIPAHPADAPARTICNNTYKNYEKFGMIWTCENPDNSMPEIEGFTAYTVLRPIPIDTSYKNIEDFLINSGIPDHNRIESEKERLWCFKTKLGTLVRFFIQPQDSNISILRGIYNCQTQGQDKIEILKYYNSIISEVRDKIETTYSSVTKIPNRIPEISRVSNDLSTLSKNTGQNKQINLRAIVFEKTKISKNILNIKFQAVKGQLPTFQAGAHIDIQLQNGLVRQYSLINGPGETDHYSIAVKVEKHGTGGSKAISENVKIGDVVAISAPHNSFPLQRNSNHTIFVAGGIGITPLLSMAKTLSSMRLSFELHYFVQSEDQCAFQKNMDTLEGAIKTYIDFSVDETLSSITTILETPNLLNKVYVCGPEAMIQKTIEIGIAKKWNESNIQFEYFKNNNIIDDTSSFKIELARSALSLVVPSGKSILEILTDNGINIESSCKQGACGTCKVRVLKGEVNHQDVFLNSDEKARGDFILTCVSRAKTDRLILDI